MKSPAFSLYPKDLLTDEKAVVMTDEEFGVYVRLLCHAWLEGSIPAEMARLARVVRRTPASLEKVWPAIAPCFRLEGDRLFNGRLEREREKQAERSRSNSASGSKGGKSRAVNAEAKRSLASRLPLDMATIKPDSNLPFPSPFSERIERTNEQALAEKPTNPLMVGGRQVWTKRFYEGVTKLAAITGEEPTIIAARATDYEGAKGRKINPWSMSEERLMNSVIDIEADLKIEEQKRGALGT